MSNLLEKASILTTPTAYNGGKLLSVKGGTPADFDFTRSSTATRVNSSGLIESVASGLPRIDYTDGVGSILLEPQSTNTISYSDDFTNSLWGKSSTTILSNQVISPDGTQNASKIYPSLSGNYRHIRYSTLNPSTGVNSFSIFAKAGELEHLVLIDYDGGGVGIDFNLSTGVATDNSTSGFDSFSMIDYGNGWYRCTATATAGYYYWILSDNGGLSVTANGTDGVYIWGAMAEQQSFATSYIPTSGSTVTRLGETLNNAGSSDLINSTEGVLYLEVAALSDLVESRMSLNNGTNLQTIQIRQSGSVSNQYNIGFSNGSLNKFIVLSDITEYNKIAVSYNSSIAKIFINGTEVATDNAVTLPTGLNNLSFDRGDGSFDYYGNVKCVAVFKEALTDAELTCLTTI